MLLQQQKQHLQQLQQQKPQQQKRKQHKANESASAGWTITISGINSKDINSTDADAAKMSAIEITVSNKKNDGTAVEQKWTGIPLKTILDFYGANDYDGVKVAASDGSISDLEMATVSDPGTILGLKLDGKALIADGIVQLIVKSQATKSLIKGIIFLFPQFQCKF